MPSLLPLHLLLLAVFSVRGAPDFVAKGASSDNTNCTTINSDQKQTAVTFYNPMYCIPADTSAFAFASNQAEVSLLVKYTYLHYGQCRENVKLTCTVSSTLIPSSWWNDDDIHKHHAWLDKKFIRGTVSGQSFYMQQATSKQANYTLTQDELSLPVAEWTNSTLNVLLRGYGYINSSTPIVKYNPHDFSRISHTLSLPETLSPGVHTKCQVVQSGLFVSCVGFMLLLVVPIGVCFRVFNVDVLQLLPLCVLLFWIHSLVVLGFSATVQKKLEYRVYNESIFNASSNFKFELINTPQSDPRCVVPTVQTDYFTNYACIFNMTNVHDYDPFNMEYYCGPLKNCTLTQSVDASVTDLYNRTQLFIEQSFSCKYDSCDQWWTPTHVIAPSVTMTGLNRTSISILKSKPCTFSYEDTTPFIIFSIALGLSTCYCLCSCDKNQSSPSPSRRSPVPPPQPVVRASPPRAPVYRPPSPPRRTMVRVALIGAVFEE